MTTTPTTAAIAAGALIVGGLGGIALVDGPSATPAAPSSAAEALAYLEAGTDYFRQNLPPAPTLTPSVSPSDVPTVLPTPSPTVTEPSPTVTPTASSVTPTPAPTPSGSIGVTFPAPALVNPTVLTYPSGTRGFTGSASLDPARDYVIKIPAGGVTNAAGLSITGGRNVIVDGGTIDVGAGINGTIRRAGVLQVTGHLWIHDLTVTSSTGSMTEGFNIYNGSGFAIPDTVTLQGITLPVPLLGTQATNHADVIQVWAGPRVLQVDGLTATTTYQGLFLLPMQHQSTVTPTGYDLRNITITAPQGAGYLLWRDGLAYPIRTTNVRVCGSKQANGGLWPNAAAWPGVLTTC